MFKAALSVSVLLTDLYSPGDVSGYAARPS